jgi:bla regulator protein BlaR1
MNASTLLALTVVTAASSMAILLVGLLRTPLRYATGARAAYWLWLLVPATAFAVLLPAPRGSVGAVSGFPGNVGTTVSVAVMKVMEVRASSGYAAAALACWLLGVFLMLGILAHRQRAFVLSLGLMTRSSDGIHRSSSIVAPMVVGAWPARLVIPTNFESRYSPEERVLMLAHERAHLVRGDAHINAIAAGWQCLFWFNPLVHWAIGRFRFDQELSCDAVVVAQSEIGRRRYADALLKTQLANDETLRVPLGCHWQSDHPLKERIAMLKFPSPTIARRLGGIGFSIGFTVLSGYAVWAAQPDLPSVSGSASQIAISMKWFINGVDVLKTDIPSSSHDFVALAGKEFVRKISLAPGDSYETRCIASLPNIGKPSPTWESVKASGQPTAGLILLECRLSNNEGIFSTPAIAVRSGKAGSIEVTNNDGSIRSKLEFTASTSSTTPVAP